MKDGDAEPLGDDCRERAVGVAEYEQAVGALLAHDALRESNYLSDLLTERFAPHAEVMIRLADAELVEENVGKRGVEVLPRVDERVAFAEAVELFDDAAEADDFGPRAEDGHYLHASMSSS